MPLPFPPPQFTAQLASLADSFCGVSLRFLPFFPTAGSQATGEGRPRPSLDYASISLPFTFSRKHYISSFDDIVRRAGLLLCLLNQLRF